MSKPLLLVVTGRPGTGKTTLAEALSRDWCLPLVSRDRIKEGLVHTAGMAHDALPEDANLRATQAFFGTLDYLTRQGISLIAEAAFQHPLWQSGLEPLRAQARIVLLICRTDPQTALDRFLARGLADEKRTYFHGDKGVRMLQNSIVPEPGAYVEPALGVETLHVDTTDSYDPSLQALHETIFGRHP